MVVVCDRCRKYVTVKLSSKLASAGGAGRKNVPVENQAADRDILAQSLAGTGGPGVFAAGIASHGGTGASTFTPYAAFGVSYLPDNTREVSGRFAQETFDNGSFTDQLEAPEVLGRIDLGLQLYCERGFDLKAGYTADLGES